MKNELKKTLSLFMVILLAISMMPAGVFAENVQPDPNIGAVASIPVERSTTTDLSVKTDALPTENSASEKAAIETTSAAAEKVNLPQLDNPATAPSDPTVPETVQTEAVSGDFSYEVIDGGVAITKYNGSASEVTVPDTIDGKPVIEVRNGFITSATTSLILGNNVKTIKAAAFGYTWLEKIVIPAATTEIDAGALYSFYNLKVLGKKGSYIESYVANNLPNALFVNMDLHENDFYYDSTEGGVSITCYVGSENNLTIPASLGGQPVVSINSKAFADNSNLKSVTIQNGVKAIKENAFPGCYSLSSMTIPESVTEIDANFFPMSIKIFGTKGSYAETFAKSKNYSFFDVNNSENGYWFEDVEGGVKIIAYTGADTVLSIPATLKGKPVVSIGLKTFTNAANLTEVVIPDSVTNLEEGSVPYYGIGIFAHQRSLVKLTFGKGITKIPATVAMACSNLEEVVFKGDVVSIGDYAFDQCSKLQKMELPQSLVSIGDRAFSYSRSLTSLSIPDKTTTIGAGAFAYCDRMENLNLGKGLTKLSDTAFASCKSLKEVSLPASLTTVESKDVFAKCASLSKVVIPDTTTSITSNIFDQSPLTSIYGSNGSYAQTYAEKYNLPFVPVQATSAVNVLYQTHVENYGWQDWKKNSEMSGTSHESLRLEAINIKLDQQQYDLSVNYATHVENYGWQDWKKNGEMSGTSHESLRLEAIRINLSGADADKFDIYYHVHAQNIGWMGWAKNGADAGTAGFAYRLEAIEIQVLPKGSPAPGSTENAFQENK
jgi:hypothetical protein